MKLEVIVENTLFNLGNQISLLLLVKKVKVEVEDEEESLKEPK
jgi:hypothetical protein